MSLLWSRFSTQTFRKPLIVVGSRFYKRLPEPSELATGLEKWQMEQKELGNDDPFRMKAIKRHSSSKTDPIIVPSYFDCRIVGCVCDEDTNSIVWMWLFKGEPRRCHCGHWFKLSKFEI